MFSQELIDAQIFWKKLRLASDDFYKVCDTANTEEFIIFANENFGIQLFKSDTDFFLEPRFEIIDDAKYLYFTLKYTR